MRSIRRALLVAALAISLLAGVGCSSDEDAEPCRGEPAPSSLAELLAPTSTQDLERWREQANLAPPEASSQDLTIPQTSYEAAWPALARALGVPADDFGALYRSGYAKALAFVALVDGLQAGRLTDLDASQRQRILDVRAEQVPSWPSGDLDDLGEDTDTDELITAADELLDYDEPYLSDLPGLEFRPRIWFDLHVSEDCRRALAEEWLGSR